MEGTHTHVISQEFFICVNADGTATYKTGNNETALFQNFGNAFETGKKDAQKFIGDYKALKGIEVKKEIDEARKEEHKEQKDHN